MCVMKRLGKASSQSALTSGAGIETDQAARGTVRSQARVQAARPEKVDNIRAGESCLLCGFWVVADFIACPGLVRGKTRRLTFARCVTPGIPRSRSRSISTVLPTGQGFPDQE